jgi:choline dehydrogenase-like flavoprotein
MEQNGMKRVPHPRYSPDLAPSDFDRWGHVKGCLAGHAFDDADDLFGAVQRILEGIEKVSLQAFFLDWIERPEKSIATDGEYVE